MRPSLYGGKNMPKYRNRSSEMHVGLRGRRIVKRRGAVFHTTEGYNSADWLLNNSYVQGVKVSADFLIERNGDIVQLSPVGWYTFHAGESSWRLFQGSDGTLNRSHVGIEMECHSTSGQVITDPQYIALAALSRRLMAFHDFGVEGLCLHRECALPLGRKSDPPFFSWVVFSREMISPSMEAAQYPFPEVLP